MEKCFSPTEEFYRSMTLINQSSNLDDSKVRDDQPSVGEHKLQPDWRLRGDLAKLPIIGMWHL